uniref:Myosin IXb n=1 Tax=Mastacembelus armatus TaxID=205130 RepID=A0A7N8YGX3_9TELE
MSTTGGAGAPQQHGESRVVQIYCTLPQGAAAYCPLQLSALDTSRTVVCKAVITLGLDSSQTYNLLEVRKSGRGETLLEAGERPLQRVLLWPPEAQKWHPQTQGYYFILQQKQSNSGFNQDESRREDYDDLCSLQTVTDESILEVLRQRFYRLKIYTYARNILIAINPNRFLPVYYNPKYVQMYEKQPLGKLSPHIFAIADVAFRTMLKRQVNQCILISGESGSGKTESSSYLIHCLTALSQKKYSSGLERTILGAGPVLEAFGNAKTSDNNNSSRFGKFIQLNYLESGIIRGAVIEKYLLEKCRLVSRDKTERNYHVFYYLLAGASKEEQEEFHLLNPQDYLYLKQVEGQSFSCEEKLGQEYKRLHQAMEMVGFLASTKKHIFSILSAILHLGNVTYKLSENSQALEVGPAEVLTTLSDLLKVKKELLVKALTMKRIVTGKAFIVSQYTLQKASKVRDSMAKCLYSALFDWIVLHINHAMLNRRDMEESVSCLSIGVLDMFGFENLHTNSFEQLCINYTNEKLLHYINQNIFKLEQDDYVSEGITWQYIDCTDNSGCIQLLGRKSTGLFDLLDRESNLPQATDETLLEKLKQQHQNNPFFELSQTIRLAFTIQHFAGKVNYHIKDFREKNTEHMRPEVISLLRSSERSFLHHLVASSPAALFRWGILRATIRILTVFKNMARHRLKYLSTIYRGSMTLDFSFDRSDEDPLDNLMDSRSLQHVVDLTAHDRTSKSVFQPFQRTRPPTISTQFQASLSKLMETIEKAEPFFIFCVRSNAEKRELHFDGELVLKQIKCTGIVQMVNLQKSGYSAKYTFAVRSPALPYIQGIYAKKKANTLMHVNENKVNLLYLILYRLKLNDVPCAFILPHECKKERQLLQDTYNKEVMDHIIILQRWFRACLIRLHFLQKRDATRIIQRSWREFYEKENRAATVIQTAWRSSQKRSKHIEMEDDKGKSTTRLGRDRYTYHCIYGLHFRYSSAFILNSMSAWTDYKTMAPGRIYVEGPNLCRGKNHTLRHPMSPPPQSITLPRYTPHPYQMPNQNITKANRNPTIRISRATRALEWNASLDREITDPKELRQLDEFLGNQVNELQSRIKKLSPTESIFLTSTMQFRETIKSMYSVQKPQIAYKDLMKGYHNKVNTLAGPTQQAEVSLVVNLFQSVLDGFIRAELKRMENEPAKPDSPLDHLFSTYQVNIMQSCDICGSYIWGMEKAHMCSVCKLICHKKCLGKITTDCSTRCDGSVRGSLHFGVQVCVLTSNANPVPKVVELLLLHVELNGLYTEGIYRKSGSACQARELHQILETNPESVCLDSYPIHTITGLVKRWLRELPDPLMTFSLYSDFLHATELPEKAERIRAIYQKIDELPPANYNTLERLIFHLVRVAKEEEHNKMSAGSLAIVFAPCVLRSPDAEDPFLSMKDVSKTTLCVETLISEQFRRYKEKMQNIEKLEHAEAMAVNQLKLKRQNTVRGIYKSGLYIVEKPSELNVPEQIHTDETEKTLIERIRSIKQEKVDLACRLPDLEQEHSDNENLDSCSSMSTESLEDRLRSLEQEGHLEHLKLPKSILKHAKTLRK